VSNEQPTPGPYQQSPVPGGQPNPYAPQPGAQPAPYGGGAPAPYGAPGQPAPYGAPGQGMPSGAGTGLSMKRRGPVAVWLLTMVTLGIYGLVWYYKVQQELGRYDSRIQVKPVNSLLALFPGGILYIPPFISYYGTGQRIRQAQHAAGLPQTCGAHVCWALGLVLGVNVIYMQSELNKVIDRYGQVPQNTPVPLVG
jgi:hypothetical protein